MKLISFRIQKYKRIDDTGWIDVDELTGFIGKNEAGKSAILTALSKLNSSLGVEFDKREDLPHLEYLQLKEDKTIYPILATFELDEKDPVIENLPKNFIVGKNYDNELSIQDFKGNELDVDQELLKPILPVFIYFDEYDLLDATFDIPCFIKQYNENKNDRNLRIKRCIFEFVGLTPELFADLDLESEKEITNESDEDVKLRFKKKKELMQERKYNCISASELMTKKFNKWWKNDYYNFEFDIDGSMFTVNISDRYDPTPVDLHQRSKGFQYFFAFFLIFTVERIRVYNDNDDNIDPILLLDEPGLYFHGSLQLTLLDFFRNLSKTNQLMYTTHSPFLVDPEKNFKNTKIVYNNEDTGKTQIAREGELLPDKIAMFPLKINWFTSQYQAYVKNKPHILLEGYTDVLVFNKINQLFEKYDSNYFLDSVIFIHGDGSHSTILLSILKSADINTIYFLDGDEAGLSREKKFRFNFDIKGFTTKEFSKVTHSTMEDLVPIDQYLLALKNTYEIPLIDSEKLNLKKPILPQLRSSLNLNGISEFDKLAVTEELLRIIQNNPHRILKIFQPIFKQLKKLIENKDEVLTGKCVNDGNFYPSGAGYGIEILKDDLDMYFPREWENIYLIFDHQNKPIKIDIHESSSDKNYRKLIHKSIGNWLIENNLRRWDSINPPTVELRPLSDRKFRVTLTI